MNERSVTEEFTGEANNSESETSEFWRSLTLLIRCHSSPPSSALTPARISPPDPSSRALLPFQIPRRCSAHHLAPHLFPPSSPIVGIPMRRRCPASHPRSTLGHPRDIRLALRNRLAPAGVRRPHVLIARSARCRTRMHCVPVARLQHRYYGWCSGLSRSLSAWSRWTRGRPRSRSLLARSLTRMQGAKGPLGRCGRWLGPRAHGSLVGACGLWGFGRRQSMCSPAHCSLSSARSGAARPAPRAPARIWARWRRRATRPAAWPGASRRGSWRSAADPGLALVPSAARRRSRVATHHHRPERSRARPRWRRPSCLRRGRGRTVCARAGGSRFGLRGRCHRSAARMARCAAAGRRRPAGPQAGAEPDGIGAHKHSLGYRWG